jgi:hypothetical protein
MPSDTEFNLGIDFNAGNTYYQTHPNAPRSFTSFPQAWDRVTGTQVWRGESNQGPTGGALAAGGVVFHGGGSSQEFRAYDASTGAKLWSMQAQTGIYAGPISYEVDGRQYIAVTVGSGTANSSAPNLSRLLVFALNGTAEQQREPRRARRRPRRARPVFPTGPTRVHGERGLLGADCANQGAARRLRGHGNRQRPTDWPG